MTPDREASDLRESQMGREAKAALEVLGRHFDNLRAACIEKAVASSPDAVALRERMIVSCQVIDAMRNVMERAVAGGAAADVRLLAETG